MTDDHTPTDPIDDLPEELREPFREWRGLEEVADRLGVHGHADAIRSLARHDALLREITRLRVDLVNMRDVDQGFGELTSDRRALIEERVSIRVELDAVETALPILSRDLEAITASRLEEPVAEDGVFGSDEIAQALGGRGPSTPDLDAHEILPIARACRRCGRTEFELVSSADPIPCVTS